MIWLFNRLDNLLSITIKREVKEEDSGSICSHAEALERQALFINSTLTQLGCNSLWKMFRHGMIEYHGLYLNLATMKVNPTIAQLVSKLYKTYKIRLKYDIVMIAEKTLYAKIMPIFVHSTLYVE